ncbi:uncharacterized protein LOC114535270 [Dendronephthya gigantea]|uniref:uncharacterized protein LOC114535270 n=1 Tax=Dendronephthya gigantea TaxID=151771 RepID=UPI00106B0E62|nr:uncharacterized protein LOC114535270 [Dendronephthya gigantea]
MGGNSSKENKEKNEEPPIQAPRANLMEDTKYVLLIHKSDTEKKEEIVENFQDAIQDKAKGSVEFVENVNINKENYKSKLKDASWLDKTNNVVLISLTSEAIPAIKRTCEERGYVNDGVVHKKVFTVSFGPSLDSQWPPQGVLNAAEDARHFAFEFEDVENITFSDFVNSGKIKGLIGAIHSV